MNKRIKKKHKHDILNVRIEEFEKAYMMSLFGKLLKCSNYDRQRWFYHAARNAARMYSKKVIKSINKSRRHLIDGDSVCFILTAFAVCMRDPCMSLREKEKFMQFILTTDMSRYDTIRRRVNHDTFNG